MSELQKSFGLTVLAVVLAVAIVYGLLRARAYLIASQDDELTPEELAKLEAEAAAD